MLVVHLDTAFRFCEGLRIRKTECSNEATRNSSGKRYFRLVRFSPLLRNHYFLMVRHSGTIDKT
jgi:hypothetical protein